MPTTLPAGWMPIESAPKDGSRVLLWNRHFDAPCSGQFYGFGDWRMDGNLPPFVYQPSHWMPLPAAPGTPPASAQDDAKDERHDSIALDKLADYIADNWPDKKYGLEEICQRLHATWPTAFMPPSDAPAAGDVRDAERLDWLEKKVVSKGMHGLSFDFVRHVEDGQVVERGVRIMWRHHLGERHRTIRAAIDEAIAASQQQEG